MTSCHTAGWTWDLLLSFDPAISGNGRYVAFSSGATNLVKDDNNLIFDVFVFDRVRRETNRVSVDSRGEEASVVSQNLCFGSYAPAIDRTGRLVTFTSGANNLVKPDRNPEGHDVFLHNTRNGRTQLVSVPPDGTYAPSCWVDLSQTTGIPEARALCSGTTSRHSAMSANGRFIAFESQVSNLVKGDTNGVWDVFVRDLVKRKIERVSLSSAGEQVGGLRAATAVGGHSSIVGYAETELGSGAQHTISADGRYVAFWSDHPGFVPQDTDAGPIKGNYPDILVRDRKKNRTELVSINSIGDYSPPIPTWMSPSMSADGRFVVFEAYRPGSHYVSMIYDRRAGVLDDAARTATDDNATRCESRTGEPSFSATKYTDISGNGRYMSFSTCGKAYLHPKGDPREYHVVLLDHGATVGAGGLVASGKLSVAGSRSFTNDGLLESIDRMGVSYLASTDLLAARLVYRDEQEDLFIKIDTKRLALPGSLRQPASVADAGVLYGLKFLADGTPYEVRAAADVGPDSKQFGSFGLFDCSKQPCEQVARLRGGYGTTGEGLQLSLPLTEVGFEKGGRLSEVEAFSALGTFTAGAVNVVDTLRLK